MEKVKAGRVVLYPYWHNWTMVVLDIDDGGLCHVLCQKLLTNFIPQYTLEVKQWKKSKHE